LSSGFACQTRQETARRICELRVEPRAVAPAHALAVERAAGERDRVHRAHATRPASVACGRGRWLGAAK
jgi:hypothetical protein